VVKKKQRAAIALVDSWLADTSGYDKRVWPRLSRRIEDPCVKPNPDPQFRESERGLRISKKLQGAVACNRCYAKLLRQRKVDMRMLMRVGVCRRCFNALVDMILQECLHAALAVQARSSATRQSSQKTW